MAVAGPRIILGLDYGTTYTGLAWLETTGGDNPGLSNVRLFRKWPRNEARKVLSAYSYSKSTDGERNWGYDISDHAEVLRWTKLELGPRAPLKELETLKRLVGGLDLVNRLQQNDDTVEPNEIPRQLARSSEDVIRDFLYEIAKQWQSEVRSQQHHVLTNVPVDIVFTHPASWSYEAKNQTYRAIVDAFHKDILPTRRHVYITSEPEACALYTIEDLVKQDQSTLIPGECFIVCDAGGGTVDVVSYRTESIKPLRLTRVGGVSGGEYGATFVDRAFLDWLRPKLMDKDLIPIDFLTRGHYIMSPILRVLLARFEIVKHAFEGTQHADLTIPRGISLDNDQVKDGDIGILQISSAEIRAMFEKGVNGAATLISRQISQVENRKDERNIPYKITNVFLSGGFSENSYLFQEVKRRIETLGRIHVQRAKDCWSGVVRGAVLRGTGIGMEIAPKVTPCPRHYGIAINEVYAGWRHDEAEAFTENFLRRQLVRMQLRWLIRKGDVILPDETTVATYTMQYRFPSKKCRPGQTFRMVFVASARDKPPSSLLDLPRGRADQNEVADIAIERSKIPEGAQQKIKIRGHPTHYLVNVVVTIEVSSRVGGPSPVQVSFTCGSKTLASHSTKL